MNNATKVNADLVRSTFKTPGARKGERLLLEFIDEKHDRQAAYLLRDHNDPAITSPETQPRDQINQLLSYYCVLLIAIYAGAIDPSEIADELNRIKGLLHYWPLERYFSSTYPPRVTKLFSHLLENTEAFNKNTWARPKNQSGIRLFFDFFDLTATFELDSDIEWFLYILEGGRRKGWNLDRLLHTLESPAVGAKILFDEAPNSGQQILRGLLKFLDFCRGLADLTDQEPELQDVRNLCLDYYEYRFRAARNSYSEMSKHIDQILKLLASQKSDVRIYLDAFRKLDYRVLPLPAVTNAPKKELERGSN